MKLNIVILSLLISATFLFVSSSHAATNDEKKVKAYIVYMGDALKLESNPLAAELHNSLLSQVIGDEKLARQSKIYSYGKSFNAFAAYLSPEEAERFKEKENVVSVFPSQVRELHTTRSWDFLGMPLSVERNTEKESDIIVGVLDSGIYIEHPSFDDKGLGSPPSKWKGVCESGPNFLGCNNKVIGARAYYLDHPDLDLTTATVADEEGHGSHTASTIAGLPVEGASLFGLGEGIARGGVPSARIAIYKVCLLDTACTDINILAAFDDAIADGVDILSLSLGGNSGSYFTDAIAIGAFHAMKNGILTSCSAGNSGPSLRSIVNGAPWILTVGASATDRQFKTPVEFGQDQKALGTSVNTFELEKKMYPLTSGVKATMEGTNDYLSQCENLDKDKVKGKIVYCNGTDMAFDIKKKTGVGTLASCGPFSMTVGRNFVIPAACLNVTVGESIAEYINSTENPQAVIHRSISTQIPAPSVAPFSARGPNLQSPSILKPDIVAPGVVTLAAFTELTSISGSSEDDRFSIFNILSGTSMACPHASAAAAYIKSFHPEWSPSAIKSALMTTTSEIKVGDKHAELSYGAGQIDPVRAVNPGLVYETSKIDYIRFLCHIGYKGTLLGSIIGEDANCSSIPKFGGQDDMNYPSMLVLQKDLESRIAAVFHRTVTNVGLANSTYKATVKAPDLLKIKVNPDTLVFKELGEKKSFKVMIAGPPLEGNSTVLSASLEWNDSVHKVKSPIVIHVKDIQAE